MAAWDDRLVDAGVDAFANLWTGAADVLPGAAVAVLAAVITAYYTGRREALAWERQREVAEETDRAVERGRTYEHRRQVYEDLLSTVENLYDIFERKIRGTQELYDSERADQGLESLRGIESRAGIYATRSLGPGIRRLCRRVRSFRADLETQIGVLDYFGDGATTPEEQEQELGLQRLAEHLRLFHDVRASIQDDLGVP